MSIEFRNVNPPKLSAVSRAAEFTEDGSPVRVAPDVTLLDGDVRCNTSIIHSGQFKFHAPDGFENETLSVDEVRRLALICAMNCSKSSWLYVVMACMLLSMSIS